jgi:hypothetical protein
MRTKLIALLALVLSAPALAAAATVGSETVLPASPLPAHEPCVAHGEDRYLVVWQSGKADKADLYACRVDEGGKALDAQPFCVSKATECQERPRAAWGKGSWLVVWADLRNDKDYDVYAARVSADGKVLDPDGILVAGGEHNQAQPDVAFNGEGFLIAWRAFEGGKYAGRGARVSPDGKVLDAQPLKLADEPNFANSVGEFRIGTLGDKWALAWITRASSMNPPAGGGGARGIYISIVAADGKATTGSLGTSQGMEQFKPPVTLASNGKDECLLSWFNSCTGGRSGPANGVSYGAMRVGADGKQLGTVVLGAAKMEVRQPAAVWDGKGWYVLDLAAHRKQPGRGINEHTNRVIAHVVAADGKYDGQVEIADGKANPAFMPAGAGDGKGNTLVVWERHPADADPLDAPILIAAKLVKR